MEDDWDGNEIETVIGGGKAGRRQRQGEAVGIRDCGDSYCSAPASGGK